MMTSRPDCICGYLWGKCHIARIPATKIAVMSMEAAHREWELRTSRDTIQSTKKLPKPTNAAMIPIRARTRMSPSGAKMLW